MNYLEYHKTQKSIFSVLVFLHFLRLVKYIRVIPTWGPMLLAVISTLENGDVLLYMLVVFYLIFVSAFAFCILYSTEHPLHLTYIHSFYIAFRGSFGGEYDTVNVDYSATNFVVFIVFMTVGITTVKLLIGMITNVLAINNLRFILL